MPVPPGLTSVFRFHLVGRLVVVCAMGISAPLPAQDSARVAALAGVVRDSTGRGIAGVEVTLDTLGLRVTTNDSGQFHLAGIPPGRNGFVVRKVGYTAASFETTLSPDRTLVVNVTLAAIQALDPVTISAERLQPRLAQVGFYEREARGLGKFLRPEAVDSLSFAVQPSHLLRTMPGIEVMCRAAAAPCTVRSRTPPYCLQLFVDGHYTPGVSPYTSLDEMLTATTVGAIEVYRHPSEIPIQFQPPMLAKVGRGVTGQAGCGALVVWTRVKTGR